MLEVINQIALEFRVQPNDFLMMGSRKQNIIDARRFLIYYLYYHEGIKHNHMCEFIEGIDHSTSIYHCNKIQELFSIERKLREKYIRILFNSDPDALIKLKRRIMFRDTINKLITIKKEK
jgi:chromosomal replication initiation ATPase DnaA